MKNENRVEVQVRTSGEALKFLPFFGSYNNFNPQLSLLEDGIEYKVFFRKYKKYSEIELVDIHRLLGINNLQFKFKDSVFTFFAKVYDENDLKNALIFLKKRTVHYLLQQMIFWIKNKKLQPLK